MSPKTIDPKARRLAQGLLAYEIAASNPTRESNSAVICVLEKLRRPVSTLAGSSGFRALLSRSLVLAKVHFPCLHAVGAGPDGTLAGWNEVSKDQAEEAGILLIAQLIGLLFAFIGVDLTVQLAVSTWPDLPIAPAELPEESRHDPTT